MEMLDTKGIGKLLGILSAMEITGGLDRVRDQITHQLINLHPTMGSMAAEPLARELDLLHSRLELLGVALGEMAPTATGATQKKLQSALEGTREARQLLPTQEASASAIDAAREGRTALQLLIDLASAFKIKKPWPETGELVRAVFAAVVEEGQALQKARRCMEGMTHTHSLLGRSAKLVELTPIPFGGKVLAPREHMEIGIVKAGQWYAFSGEVIRQMGLGLEEVAMQGEQQLMEVLHARIADEYHRSDGLKGLLEIRDREEEGEAQS